MPKNGHDPGVLPGFMVESLDVRAAMGLKDQTDSDFLCNLQRTLSALNVCIKHGGLG